jgi:hypothetical protein
MPLDPTLPPPFDPPQPRPGGPLGTSIEPPPIAVPRTAQPAPPLAETLASPPAFHRAPRQRVSLFRRGWNYVSAAFRRALHDAPPHEHQPSRSLMERVIGGTPPWLVSLCIHAALIIMLGLLAVQVHQQVAEEMTVAMAPDEDLSKETFAETLGQQLEVPDAPAVPEGKATNDPTYSISGLPEISDPFAAPPKAVDLLAEGTGAFSDIMAPSIGNSLKGRQTGSKELLLGIYGGTMTTQHSVELALAWLSRQQGRDGLWSLQGPYPDGSSAENKISATAMALLAFLGDGHTHLKNGPHRQTVARGVKALLKLQGEQGELIQKGGNATHRMYAHAQATIVLCELYAMSQDSEIREAAERAVDYCLKDQAPTGGWRYFPQQEGDVSVTGWVVMALQSARMATLQVPSEDLIRVGKFLDSASSHGGSRYAYLPGQGEKLSMTAEALLCRQYLGWKHDDKRLLEGVDYLSKHPVDWGDRNVYYWYYATQVMHHMGGKPWIEWNKVMRQVVPEHQIGVGKQHGSWDPDEQAPWGRTGGRLFVTCLSTYMLEVYYRHLPLYANVTLASASESMDESEK